VDFQNCNKEFEIGESINRRRKLSMKSFQSLSGWREVIGFRGRGHPRRKPT